ncbi:MAG: hypothetical protein IKP26_06735 [Clostridia bacterium]|nr:hypothetical protein [Clostridia bacterium]MBR6109915.1 hypothetical protein [Clostridia bacterium]
MEKNRTEDGARKYPGTFSDYLKNNHLPRKIYTYSGSMEKCANCGIVLRNGYTKIRSRENKMQRIEGLKCELCGRLYVKDDLNLRELLLDNHLSKGITLNGEDLPRYTEKKERERIRKELDTKMKKISSAIVGIRVKENEDTIHDYLIVADKEDCTAANKDILFYESQDAREILTAAFHKSRAHKGEIRGVRFKVLASQFDSQTQKLSRVLINEVIIKKGGGYFTQKTESEEELVHLLLYSPFTKRYEIINATFNNSTKQSYVDYKRYRDFVYKYGNPGLPIYNAGKTGRGLRGWDKLNAESVLKSFGYSVDQASNKSTYERREVLKDLVDMDIMPIYEIVSYLDFFIDTHQNEKYELARAKWEKDKDFISAYKFNKNRFLIVEEYIPRKTLID